jgi:hypothetical protein
VVDLVNIYIGALTSFIEWTEEVVELLQITKVVSNSMGGNIPLVFQVFCEPVYVVLHEYSFGMAARGLQNGDQ